MKNIHVLPTDKPSELYINMQGVLSKSNSSLLRLKSRNIYITSDEEIKDGDWYIYLGQINKRTRKNPKAEYPFPNYQKIILTTDPELIKDGVQAIPDEFLEWFVENPSCEYVDLIGLHKENGYEFLGYEVIIPKEEPYSEIQRNSLELNKIFVNSIDIKSLDNIMSEFDEPKQEALEEAVLRVKSENEHYIDEESFELGAKWQAERMYSEEDLKFAYTEGCFAQLRFIDGKKFVNADEWFEQFKKK